MTLRFERVGEKKNRLEKKRNEMTSLFNIEQLCDALKQETRNDNVDNQFYRWRRNSISARDLAQQKKERNDNNNNNKRTKTNQTTIAKHVTKLHNQL